MRLWDGKAAAIAIGLFAVGCSLSAWGQTTPKAPPDSSAQEILNPGVVVEEVEEGWGADQSGILKGDILLTWSRGDAGGKLESPFDMDWLDTEERPRGAVLFQGLRGPEHRSWTMVMESWRIKTSPSFKAVASLVDEASVASALRLTDNLAVSSRLPWLRPWLLARRADLLAKAKRWGDANDAYEQAVEAAATSEHWVRVDLLTRWGDTAVTGNNPFDAEKVYLQAKEETTGGGAETLATANVLQKLGTLQWHRRALASGSDYYLRCLHLQEKIVPESYDVAWSLLYLITTVASQGDLSGTERYLAQAERLDQISDRAAGFGETSILTKGVGHFSEVIWLGRSTSSGSCKRSRRIAGRRPRPSIIWATSPGSGVISRPLNMLIKQLSRSAGKLIRPASQLLKAWGISG